jgi:predicted aldo/keto reductase-like oxidoreductase
VQNVKFGKTDLMVSRFGMGCMRFPKTKAVDGSEIIDEKETIKMIRYAVDNGVNYFDTAYTYPGSEVVLGKALKDIDRNKVIIASKLPVWKVQSYQDCFRFLDEELKSLQTDYIDVYLLHNLTQSYWDMVKDFEGIKFLNKALEQGKIRYIGFSFHDHFKLFKEIVDSNDWDMCQIQLNILDEDYQAGIKGLKYAASKGLPVVIMEPLKGGKLVQYIPDKVRRIWNESGGKRTPAEWCFRWLYNMPEVTVVLSGVSDMKQLKENIEIFQKAQENVMNREEIELIERVKNAYKSLAGVGCTGCNYCMPCPEGVNIPQIFDLYNESKIMEQIENSRNGYKNMMSEENNDASKCIECGNCEAQCPQNIPIIGKLKEIHEFLR